MKKVHIIYFLICCTGCQTGQPSGEALNTQKIAIEAVPIEAEKKVVVFFGNSITAGYQLDLSEAFPALIQNRFDSLKLPYRTVNAGLSGETSASGATRVGWVLKQKMDVFVLELGANDGLRGIKTTETIKNLQNIIDQVMEKYPSCKIILAGMHIPPNMGQDYTTQFQKIYPLLAANNNIPLIPFLLEGVAGKSKLNLADGIHPTPEGHEIIAENVWKILSSQL